MPSVSRSQQRIMGLAWAYQKGDLELDDIPAGMREKVQNVVDTMKPKDLSDFAHTTHEGLPETVSFIIDRIMKEAGRSTTPQYRVEVNQYQVFGGSHMTNMGWDVKHSGKPSKDNIKKYVEVYNASLEPNGVNSQVGRAGAIYGAKVVNQKTGEEIEWQDRGIIQEYKNKPKFEVHQAVKVDVDASIKKMEEMTSDNDHTGSIVELAKLVGDKRSEKILKKVIEIHQLVGSMPQSLQKFREEMFQDLIQKAKNNFDSEIVTKIKSAF